MAILKNARHEKFCQLVASGMSAAEAYTQAGYAEKGAKDNASRLMTKLGDELVRGSVDQYLRISPLWRLAHRMPLSRAIARRSCLFVTACDAGVGRKVKLNHGIVVVL
jgi:hypothetical protein